MRQFYFLGFALNAELKKNQREIALEKKTISVDAYADLERTID